MEVILILAACALVVHVLHLMLILAMYALAGHVVFHGPREDVVEFFESCGFKCPERKGVPDFLQEVTSKNDQKVHCVHCIQLIQTWVCSQGLGFVDF